MSTISSSGSTLVFNVPNNFPEVLGILLDGNSGNGYSLECSHGVVHSRDTAVNSDCYLGDGNGKFNPHLALIVARVQYMGSGNRIHIHGRTSGTKKSVYAVHSQTQEAPWQWTGRQVLEIVNNGSAETGGCAC